jgi:ferredoxin-NADP reductase
MNSKVKMSLQTFPLILKETYMVTPSVRHFVFVRPVGESPLQFIPGQFITVHFRHEGQLFRRSYSIATIPEQTDGIEFAASYVKDGPGSEFLFQLKIGDALETSGPFGRLVLGREESPRYILVATGTGVTPYRAMLSELNQRLVAQENLQVILLLGVRNRMELLYGDDFIAFANRHSRFHFIPHYSREAGNDLQSFERLGYVQTKFDTLNLNPQEDIVYLCGNPDMIDESFVKLREIGFDTSRVRREKYISSGAKQASVKE